MTTRVPNMPYALAAISALIVWLVAGSIDRADATVLRDDDGAPMVPVFKGADELLRFNKRGSDEIGSLTVCQVAQGSEIEVLGSGYRTAFVKIIGGPASGCQGTVPINNVRER